MTKSRLFLDKWYEGDHELPRYPRKAFLATLIQLVEKEGEYMSGLSTKVEYKLNSSNFKSFKLEISEF